MPSTSSSSAPGIAAAVARPPETCTIRSARPCTTSVGTRAAQAAGPVGLGQDRHHLAQRAAGRDPAVEGLAGELAGALLVAGEAGRADHPPHRDAALGVGLAARLDRAQQRGQQPRVLPADRPLAGGRHDARQRAHPRGPRSPSSATIIPPIDTPTRWADAMPRWSSRPKASAARSSQASTAR